MNIGEKIRRLRLSKLMTQADLAGDRITRNMLSSIEHGTALPSLSTALYLAERLGVPIGYLLAAEEEDELPYRKMRSMANIRAAYAAGDYAGCLSLLGSAFGEEKDDELALLRAECEYGLARNAFAEGHLRFAAAAIDRALRAAAGTIYQTAWMRARIAVYFRYLTDLSPTLGSDVLDAEEIERARAAGDEFCDYCMAREALADGRTQEAADYLARYPASPYAARLAALAAMRAGEIDAARAAYEALLSREDLTFGALLYEVFGDMEECCRQSDDYKRAYEFANSRIGLLEHLLEEV